MIYEQKLYFNAIVTQDEAWQLAKGVETLFGRPAEWVMTDFRTLPTYYTQSEDDRDMPTSFRELLDELCVSYCWQAMHLIEQEDAQDAENRWMKSAHVTVRDHEAGRHIITDLLYPWDPKTKRVRYAAVASEAKADPALDPKDQEIVLAWAKKTINLDGLVIIPQSHHELLALMNDPAHAFTAKAMADRIAQQAA